MVLVSISQKTITAGALAALSTSMLRLLILAGTMSLVKLPLVTLSSQRANCLWLPQLRLGNLENTDQPASDFLRADSEATQRSVGNGLHRAFAGD
jgi:hypothetical protein